MTQSAWHSLFRGAAAGRIAAARPGDAWRVLAKIVVRKAGRLARRHGAARRDAARDEPGRAVAAAGPTASGPLVAGEELSGLLAELPAAARPAARRWAAGADVIDAAAATGRTARTVRRDAARLRAAAARRFGPPDLPATENYADYLLTRLVGAGGTGKVYRATHRPTGEAVAVKYLRKRFVGDAAAARRFRRGAAAAGLLRDAGVVPVRGAGRTPAGGWFLALDLIDGPDLQRVIDRHAAAGGRVPVGSAARWAGEVAATLARCHAAGVRHGDLKPANVLLATDSPTAPALLTDFAPPPADRSDDGGAFGTPAFCAPEQADPRRHGRPGDPADAWGAGAILFALLTGRPPRVGGGGAALLARAARGEPVPPVRALRPDVPAAIAALCDAALAVRPADRPGVREMADSLRKHRR